MLVPVPPADKDAAGAVALAPNKLALPFCFAALARATNVHFETHLVAVSVRFDMVAAACNMASSACSFSGSAAPSQGLGGRAPCQHSTAAYAAQYIMAKHSTQKLIAAHAVQHTPWLTIHSRVSLGALVCPAAVMCMCLTIKFIEGKIAWQLDRSNYALTLYRTSQFMLSLLLAFRLVSAHI